LKVEIQNLEKQIEDVKEKDEQRDVSKLEDEVEQLKGMVSDFKWIFNDFDDLANLKLLSIEYPRNSRQKQELEEAQGSENDEKK